MTTLAILVPCLSNRPWDKVVRELERQSSQTGGAVRVFHHVDDGEMTSGQKRHHLCQIPEVKSSSYRAFVDDDDQLAPDYVRKLVAGCEIGVDVVSFNLQFHNSKRPTRTELWRYGLYPNRRARGLMCVNHLCAWKTSIADRVAWCPRLGYGDDHLWFQPLYHAGVVSSHHHVDSVLYHYLFNPDVTANQSNARVVTARAYVGFGLGCYKVGQEIVVQDGHGAPVGKIFLRDRNNAVGLYDLESPLTNRHYHNVTIA